MSDDSRNTDTPQARQTEELRPERLGQTERLRPERLGLTEKLRPERLGQADELRPGRLGEPLSATEVEERMAGLPDGWKVAKDGDRLILERHFPSILAAAGFVIQVVEIGAAAGYVPEVLLDDQEVKVGVATSIHGELTEYDFKLARQIQPA